MYHRKILFAWRRSWLNLCTKSLKVAGSVPDGVTGIFVDNSSGRTMALGLTHLVIEMSTRNISRGKGGR
jgi:hypothetical protein